MLTWWNNLDIFARIYALIGVPSALVLIVQTILTLVGGDFDGDGVDLDGDGMPDTPGDGASDGLSLFSVRGIMAFLTVGAWSGLAFYTSGMNRALTLLLSLVCGFAALVGIAYLMRAAMKLQSDGTINMSGAVGKTGRVYIPIPPHSGGSGKITLTLQERFIEAEAVTTCDRKLATGEAVRVVATDGVGLLVVEPLEK